MYRAAGMACETNGILARAPPPFRPPNKHYSYTFQIPHTAQRPAALLELLGGARCRAGVPGVLTALEASAACKTVVAMLLPAENTEEAEETEAGVR